MAERRVAVKPLNPEAVRAANAAVAADTGGRPIGLQETELRKKWMDAYVAAGGEVKEVQPRGRGPGDPCESCTDKKLELRVIELEYLSDHDLLKDNMSDWTKSGSPYAPPDWTPGSRNPISHSMDKEIEVKVVVEAGPDGSAESGRLIGKLEGRVLFDSGITVFTPGKRHSLIMQTRHKVRKLVRRQNVPFDWLVATEKSYRKWTNIGTTTTDPWYTTIDTPRDEGQAEDGVTLKRMDKAVQLVSPLNTIDPHRIVHGLISKFPFYTLKTDPTVPAAYNHPSFLDDNDAGLYPQRDLGGAWLMAENTAAAGECQAIVRFVRGVIFQVGCPGKAEAYVVWAYDNDAGDAQVMEAEYFRGYSDPSVRPYRISAHGGKSTKVVSGKTWYAALADSDPGPVGSTFTSATVGLNNFEACLRFEHDGKVRYYTGGAGGSVFSTKEGVITVFHSLLWYSVTHLPDGSSAYKVEAYVKKWR